MKYLLLATGMIVLAGCSSTPQVVDQTQYCHTSSTKTLTDGDTASSEIVVECTDKPNPRANFETGMDGRSCGWARQVYPIAGRLQVNYVMACQMQDGSWTYVPNHIAQ